MRFATWLAMTAMFGGLAVFHGFHQPEGLAVADAGLAQIRGLSHGSATETKDVCSGSNITENQITAAQCMDSPSSGRECVSCGTGQLVVKPGSAGKYTVLKELNCSNFQKRVGHCLNSGPPDYEYTCRDMVEVPGDENCVLGTYQKLIEQRELDPPGVGDPIQDSFSP